MTELHGKGLRITQINEDGTAGKTMFLPNAEIHVNLTPLMPSRPAAPVPALEPSRYMMTACPDNTPCRYLCSVGMGCFLGVIEPPKPEPCGGME